MISFKTQTIRVVRAARITERGDEILDWSNTTEHDLPGCSVQPDGGDEVTPQTGSAVRDAVIRRWRVMGPPDPDITALDRVRHDGVLYDVDGSINEWTSPTGALDHSEFVLQRVDG